MDAAESRDIPLDVVSCRGMESLAKRFPSLPALLLTIDFFSQVVLRSLLEFGGRNILSSLCRPFFASFD